MMLVSRLLAMVGNETVKIRLAVPAIKLPSAALISSNQLIRESMSREDGTQKMRVACFVFVLVFDCPINFIVADHRFILGTAIVPVFNRSRSRTRSRFCYHQCLSINSRQNFNVDSTSSAGTSAP
jgi:hypothetical protein